MSNMVGENFGQDAVAKVGKNPNNNSDGPAGPQSNYNGNVATTRVNEVVAASTWNKEILSDRGKFIAEDCLFGGTQQLWSPGLNIHRTPFSGRNFEYYSEDGVMSFLCASSQVKAMQEHGVNASPKHFAGNDQETHREFLCTYTSEQAMRQGYLKAFEGAFTDGGALGTMMSCSRVGNHLTYSYKNLLKDLLRDEWDFKGVTITDSVASWGTTNPTIISLVNGTDTFNARRASGTEIRMQIVQTRDGYLLQELRRANKHFFYAMSRSNLINGFTSEMVGQEHVSWWKIALYVIDGVFAATTLGAITMYVLYRYNILKGKKEN